MRDEICSAKVGYKKVPKFTAIPISHGKNNNLHIKVRVGSRKNPLFNIKVVAFFETEKAYIASSSVPSNIYALLNKNIVYKEITKSLKIEGFELVVFGEDDLLKRRTSEDILQLLKDSEFMAEFL
jgi:hypothetical protein